MLPLALALVLSATPEVAILSSQGEVAELRFQPLGLTALTAPVARFSHGEGSAVLGSLLPRSRVVIASATTASRGDLSFSNVLVRLEAGKPARLLASQLAYGSRPLVTAEGRVFISRGVAGPDSDELRVDALSVEEIDPATARTRPVYATQGAFTFLAGALGRELIIYEVTPRAARLIAVHVDTLAVREVLPTMAGLAHDFVVDAARRRVLFTQGTPGGRSWFVEEVDLVSGASKRLVEGPEVTLLPAVWPDGRVLISTGAGAGLETLGGERVVPAHGAGFERLVVQHQGLIVGLHERPSDFPSVFATQHGKPVTLAAPSSSRLDVAGVIP
ncbi:MAG: hypothetical protein Q8L48_43520 [Archangium sp.]|nr:hypothetical protein [Archangium sp.]